MTFERKPLKLENKEDDSSMGKSDQTVSEDVSFEESETSGSRYGRLAGEEFKKVQEFVA